MGFRQRPGCVLAALGIATLLGCATKPGRSSPAPPRDDAPSIEPMAPPCTPESLDRLDSFPGVVATHAANPITESKPTVLSQELVTCASLPVVACLDWAQRRGDVRLPNWGPPGNARAHASVRVIEHGTEIKVRVDETEVTRTYRQRSSYFAQLRAWEGAGRSVRLVSEGRAIEIDHDHVELTYTTVGPIEQRHRARSLRWRFEDEPRALWEGGRLFLEALESAGLELDPASWEQFARIFVGGVLGDDGLDHARGGPETDTLSGFVSLLVVVGALQAIPPRAREPGPARELELVAYCPST